MAAVSLLAGGTKLLIPREKLAQAPGGGSGQRLRPGFVKTLGAVELLDPVELVCRPPDVASVLVPLAAVGLATIMGGAAIVELRRQESKHVLVNLTYLALIAFVAIGRFGPDSFR